MSQRIKGQEISLNVVLDGAIQDSITDIRNFEVTPKIDILDEQYLGQTTDQFDEIFKGVHGKFDIHFESQDVFLFIQAVVNRARRRTPGTVVNIKATLNFPNGDRPRVALQNVFFADFPITFGSRSDYGQISMEFSASEVQFLTA